MANLVVVDEVGDQENGRDGEGGDHELFVERDFVLTDGVVAEGQENGAGAV